ncbi:MAG: ATPase, P-type (transporting), superfamily, subfamily [Nocardioides sp.]|nr:ATPase, P-type (transporting), superfamily, subfamily [Nocardioides sp.]
MDVVSRDGRTAQAPSAPPAPYTAASAEVLHRLGTDAERGLDQHEAHDRLSRLGPNALAAPRRDPLVLRMLRQVHSPLIYVLLAAAATTAVLGEYVDAGVILGVVLVNALVGFVQESKALEALDHLRSLAHTETRVLRDGSVRTVTSEDLVTGDLVLLEAGEKVPADLRVLDATQVLVDESALTGESVPVDKLDAVLAAATRVADRSNMLYAGSFLRSGSARAVVVATGSDTELGAIHRLVSGATVLATPLTRKLAHFSAVLTMVIVALAAVAFAIGTARGEDAPTMFTAAVALAVGAIPEGLPAAVTITLAIGVKRLVSRNAVVRLLPAVETLGGTTVICTDKTGTLTTNQMTVRAIWTPDGSYDVSGAGYSPDGDVTHDGTEVDVATLAALRWCLVAGTACNDAAVSLIDEEWQIAGDPTEAAMKVVALKTGVHDAGELGHSRVATVPFDSRTRYMATLHRDTDSEHDSEHDSERRILLVKGAVEQVAGLCHGWLRSDGTTGPLDVRAVESAAEVLAGRGMRVLATAVDLRAASDATTAADLGGGLVLTGLQAMIDPPRPAATAAVAACHAAGIEVKMITGDHAATAAAVAAEVGVEDRPVEERVVVTGAELAAMSGAEYTAAVSGSRVFARVSPEEKLRLVEELQKRGHVVAMTGDGVNDAPALRRADIGISMGRGGTEVAKDASDMVLADDDFATIEAAVEEGRGVFDNLTKFIVWTLPTNMGEGLVILVAILFGGALPILPTQILWINMTTAVVLGLTLAFEQHEPGIMQRPPRAPDLPLLTRALVWRTALVAGLLVAASWWVFVSEQGRGAGLAEARTAAVNVFVAVEIAYLLSCRSLTRASWRLGLLTNRWVVGGVLLQVLLQAAFTYLPVMNDVFGTAPLEATAWLKIAGVTAVVSLVVAVDKGLSLRLRGAPTESRAAGQVPVPEPRPSS